MNKLFFTFLFSCILNVILAQDPYYLVIDKSKGLPSNSVYDIFQDSKGFIWIAHNEGLTRYDGYEFKTYSSKEQVSKPGSDIHEDKYGRIWYENFDGFIYYVENDSLKELKQKKPVGFYHLGIINDKLYVVQKNGIDVYDLKQLHILKTIKINITSIYHTQQALDEFYISGNPFFKIDKNDSIINLSLNPKYEKDLPSFMVSTIHKAVFYSKFNDNKMCYQVNQKAIEPMFALNNNEFIQNASYTDSCYWFCTPNGVFGFDEKGNSLYNNTAIFANKSISAVLKDREGNFWFASNSEGILFVPDISSKVMFNQFKPNKIELYKDAVFIGTKNDEVYKADLSDYSVKRLYKGISNHEINYVHYDSVEKQILFTSKGFNIIDEKGKKIREWIASVKDCQRVNSNYYAVAISGAIGLISLNKKEKNEWDNTFNAHIQKNNAFGFSTFVTDVRGKSVAYNKPSNAIYYATNIGLYKVTPNSSAEIKQNNTSIYISKLIAYTNCVYALNTQGEVLKINDNDEITNQNNLLNLQNTTVRKIKIQNDYLFLVTAQKLLYVNLNDKTNTIKSIDIYTNEINDLVLYKNKLLLSTDAGIIMRNFIANENTAVAPVLIVNSFKANAINYSPSQSTELNYKQNNIEINYSILSFKTDFKYPLYYKINDAGWELAPAETRVLKLASLSPGDYKINFKFEKQAVFQTIIFSIAKPFWLKGWFLSICFVLFLSSIIIYFKWQVGLIIKRNKLLSEKIELENIVNQSMLTSIKSQMNPHFFYNALNTIQSFIFSDDKKNATNYLGKFSKLTRMILEMSEKETVLLSEEIKALTLYLEIEKVRFNNDFEFNISFSTEVNIELIKIPSMIIQPYVENAIKHGLLHKKENKKLIVEFQIIKSYLQITIDDNGIGRKRSEELNKIKTNKHQSFATQANQKRLDILNKGKNLKAAVEYIDKTENNNPSGTIVIITIPVM